MFDVEAYLKEVFARCIRSEKDLHDYQIFAVEWLKENPYAALFIDVGLGKTIIILTLLDWMIQRGFEGKILIIAPIKVCNRTWVPEFGLWRHTAYMQYHNLRIEDDDPRLIAFYATKYERLKILGLNARLRAKVAALATSQEKERLRILQINNKAQIHIINHEAVDWLVDQLDQQQRRWPYKVVVFDESTRLRDHNSRGFNALKNVRGLIDRFIELTATPAPQTYMYFFSQIWLLDKGQRFGSFITHFRKRYFDYDHYKRTYTLLPGKAEEIEAHISDICLTMRRKDYLDLADPVVVVRPIQLSPAIKQQYEDFEMDAVLTAPDEELIVAETGATLHNKLLQLASGAVYSNQGEAKVFHDEKIDDLRVLIEQTLDEPILVTYWFKSTLDRLKKAFPWAGVMDKAGRMEEAWNKRKHKVMFAHPASIGHGMNLQFGGHHLAIFDMFHSLELFLQLIGRLNRQGQTETVIVHLLQAVGTHDVAVASKWARLEDAQEAMFDRLKRLRKERLAHAQR